MNQKIILFLLFTVIGCTSGKKKKSSPIEHHPDNQFHKTDLRLHTAKSGNVMTEDSDLYMHLMSQEQGTEFRHIIDVPSSPHLFLIGMDSNHFTKIDSLGKPIFTIDREGRGPGEFTYIADVKIKNDKLFLLDGKQQKISIYNLNGTFIRDIVLEVSKIETFEVTDQELFVVPNLTFFNQSKVTPLFYILDKNGNKIDSFGENQMLWNDFKKSGSLEGILELSPDDSILALASVISGSVYIYNLKKKEYIGSFSIQEGEEWEKHVEANKGVPGIPYRVTDLEITTDNVIIINHGGTFKDDVSVMMMINKQGKFLGRIFKNNDLDLNPTSFTLVNDSTMWVHHFVRQNLLNVTLRPVQHEL